MDTYTDVNFPGASAVEILFDPASATETNCDYVRLYCDSARQTFFGLEKYHGGRGGTEKTFPGINNRESLIIPAASFVLHFHSDGSNTDWGYKLVAAPTTKAPNCRDAAADIRRAGKVSCLPHGRSPCSQCRSSVSAACAHSRC
jgi:hypothetical protein